MFSSANRWSLEQDCIEDVLKPHTAPRGEVNCLMSDDDDVEQVAYEYVQHHGLDTLFILRDMRKQWMRVEVFYQPRRGATLRIRPSASYNLIPRPTEWARANPIYASRKYIDAV